MLGVLDWGVGSLFAVQRVRELEPSADVVVLSDSGSTPYGLQARRPLSRRLSWAVQQLVELGATEVLVACHAASTVLPHIEADVPVHGVICADRCPPGRRVGVVGGRRTIRSLAWRRALEGREVTQRVAQPWSALVERGVQDGPALDAAIEQVLSGLPPVDVLVLACTHYPALRPWLAERLGATVLWDPAAAVVDQLVLASGQGSCVGYTTGERADLRRMSERLGLPLNVNALP